MPSENLPHGKPFVFKMINHNLSNYVDEDNFVLGLPKFSLGPLNTEIELKPNLGSSIYGRFKYSYNRLDLSTLGEIELVHQGEIYLHDLIPRINELGLLHVDDESPLKFLDDLGVPYIAASEIVNRTLPSLGSSNQTFLMMSARPNSYVFTGSVSIKLTRS